ncbi:unnamed protein product [Symbiodinium natans]|uniref:Uncharacterized protein n=1 Tax=Symbiodinium natans TaxID=878477 RepID=A0A812R2Z5_9DINO|nr:unnamed protein product [Symbiodinium natans]
MRDVVLLHVGEKLPGGVQSFPDFGDISVNPFPGGPEREGGDSRGDLKETPCCCEVSELRSALAAVNGEMERCVQAQLKELDQAWPVFWEEALPIIVPLCSSSYPGGWFVFIRFWAVLSEAFADRFTMLESKISARLEASEQSALQDVEERGPKMEV